MKARTRACVVLGIGVLMCAMPLVAPSGAAANAEETPVPCDTAALMEAIVDANTAGFGTLKLASHCVYGIETPAVAGDGLPVITGNITLIGGKDTTIERVPGAASPFRRLHVANTGVLELKHLTVRGGNTAGLGGGILNEGFLNADKVVFTQNVAGNGGGLSTSAGATSNIFHSEFVDNDTTGVGGGGILTSGDLFVKLSTFSFNTAPINGGGLNVQGSGVATIEHSTFDHNTSGGLGGGISNLGVLSLTGSEVVQNTGSAGGGIATGNANVTLVRTSVRDNIPDNCSPPNTIPGCVN